MTRRSDAFEPDIAGVSLDRFHVNNFWGGWEVAGADFGLTESHEPCQSPAKAGDPVIPAMLRSTGFPLCGNDTAELVTATGRHWMIANRKICVVLPAYNAARTLEMTFREIPADAIDDVILVDDASTDGTFPLANNLGVFAVRHDCNKGYGGNQKTCYRLALERGADIIIMLHPDYQYSPKLLLPMASMLCSGLFDVVLGSRVLGIGALAGGMPVYKYIANRALTFVQNILLGYKLSEYHTGYRAFTRDVLEAVPLGCNSDDFIFDNQMLSQVIYLGFKVGEISCPAKYFSEASSINLYRSITYGLGVLKTSISFRLARLGFDRGTIFEGLRR